MDAVLTEQQLILFLGFILCALLASTLAGLSLLPFIRRINVEFWTFALEYVGKKQGVQQTAAVLDTWSSWLGFLWGLSLLPLCLGLYADVFGGGDGGILGMGYTPIFCGFTIILMAFSCILSVFIAFIRWLLLRRRDQA